MPNVNHRRRWGMLTRVANKLGLSVPHVWAVYHGHRKSKRVERAIKEALRRGGSKLRRSA